MTEMVRGAVQTGPLAYEIREFPRPRIGPDEGLLRVEACGVCGSDVEQYRGHLVRPGMFPLIPGHEPLGIVEEVGERAAERWGVEVGDRVAVEILRPCRACDHCLTGRYMSCPNRDGAYGMTPAVARAEPVGRVRRIPVSASVGDPAQDAQRHAARDRGHVQPARRRRALGRVPRRGRPRRHRPDPRARAARADLGDRGAGARARRRSSSPASARDEKKLALAREFGADHTINVESEDVVERVREITDGAMADVVLELTPIADQPIRDAVEAVRHSGRIVLAGLKGGKSVELVTDRLINKGLTVRGAFGVNADAYIEAIRIIESGRFPLEKMHSGKYELADTEAAIRELADGDAVHVCVCPEVETTTAERRAVVGAATSSAGGPDAG